MGEQMRVRGGERRERGVSGGAMVLGTKDAEGRCPLSRRIVKARERKETRAIRAIVVAPRCSFFLFGSLFRRRANKPNEVVTRRRCTYVRKVYFRNVCRQRSRVSLYYRKIQPYDRSRAFSHIDK